jgi:polysaccharide biosynthesis/export protein
MIKVLACAAASLGMVVATTPAAYGQTASGAATRAQAAPTGAPSVSLSDGYVLGPGDVIEVSLLGREDYKARVQVQTDGTIQLPYLNSIPVANKTVLQLREDIASGLKRGGFFTSPLVSITVATYASRYVVVLGEVTNPGVVPIDRAYRASEILARVGGAKATASDTLTIRRASGQELQLPVERIAVGSAADDPVVEPGDKIYLAAAPTFYIYGQVNAPGTFKVQPGMTLRMALAQGGGLSDRGSEKRIKVFRAGKEITRQGLDATVMGGDVIVAGERFF